jgi:hypothetical protein
LGALANFLGAATDPTIYGKLIFLWSLVGYIGSIPFFWKSGKAYKKHIEELE